LSTPSSTSSDKGTGPRIPRLGWLIAFILFVAIVAFAFQQWKRIPRGGGAPLDKYGNAPEFTLTDQTGQPVSLKDLKGKVWVADFVFTECKGPCPAVTGRMSEINQQLVTDKASGDVRLVTFTVDPENDTPAVLADYGKSVGADPKTWKLLTGPQSDMQRIISKGFFQALAQDKDGVPIHSTRFVVVDRDGVIRGFEDSLEPEAVQKVLLDIGTLLREPVSVNSGKTAQ